MLLSFLLSIFSNAGFVFRKYLDDGDNFTIVSDTRVNEGQFSQSYNIDTTAVMVASATLSNLVAKRAIIKIVVNAAGDPLGSSRSFIIANGIGIGQNSESSAQIANTMIMSIPMDNAVVDWSGRCPIGKSHFHIELLGFEY